MMGIEIYTHDTDGQHEQVVLVCNTTDKPFSNVMWGTEEEAKEFIEWCPGDPRGHTADKLEALFSLFSKARALNIKIKVEE